MPKLYTSQDFISMPWKNGLGMTTELIKFEDQSNQKLFFRLSVADVKHDGPFSIFPGIDRCLLILEGNGCKLAFFDQKIELKNKLVPFHFKGEEAIHCQLINGSIKDFNIMIDRNWGTTHVEILEGTGKLACLEDYLYLFDVKDFSLYELRKGESLEMKSPDHKKIVIRVRRTI